MRRLGGLALLSLVWAALGTPTGARAAETDLNEHNVVLWVPTDFNAWSWMPYDSGWKKYDIVKGAALRLETLKNGEKAEGHGGLVHLAVRAAKDGDTLESVCKDKKIPKFLTGRLKSGADSLELEDSTILPDIPCKIFRVRKATAKNMNGKVAKTEGVLVVSVFKKRIYLLRAYVWPTEYDEESLSDDIAQIETDGLRVIDSSKEKEAAPPPKPTDDETPEVEEVEEKIELEAHNLVFIKHAKLPRAELSKMDKHNNMILKFESNSQFGSMRFWLYAHPPGDGMTKSPPNLDNLVAKHPYNHFLTAHPSGDISTFKWPKKPTSKTKTFLVLPDLDPEKALVVFDGKRKPRDLTAGTASLQKYGFYDQPKVKHIGPEIKAKGQTHRSVMRGLTERSGMHTELRYGWISKNAKNEAWTYFLFIDFTRDAWKKFEEPVRATLESFKLPKKWERRWR